jgi:regulator of nucleoside diphosphate kinase
MHPPSLHLTRSDLNRLRTLVNAAVRTSTTAALERLRDELNRAVVTEPAAVPPDLVTLGSFVKIEDLYTGEVEEYTLTFPDQADIGSCRLSVLSPVGTALLGCREGAIVDWPTPGGIRRLKIHRVSQPALAGAED